MYLFYGVLCLCFTVFLFAFTLLGARNPVRPFWAGESMFANVLVPFILSTLVLGIACCAKAFMVDVLPSFLEWGYAVMTTVATVVIVKMMGIRKKLAAFSAEEINRADVIQVDFQANGLPEAPINDNPGYRKAA